MTGTATLLLLCLLCAVTPQSPLGPNHYILSPNLPPTAFIGQYYTCNFRVSGLTAPRFTFVNLPDCFTHSQSGAIEGIPDVSGSFSVTVRYQQGAARGQETIVLRVTQPNYNASLGRSLNRPRENLNWIELSVPDTYRVGDRFSVNLNQNSQGKYRWSYLQLPEMLQGDTNGNLRGAFYDEGYYSFGATCSDQHGNSLDYFFTINVQPLPTSTRTVLLQVPNRNVFRYRFDQIQALQLAALANLQKAQKAASLASEQLGRVKGDVETTESNLEMARKQVEVVQKLAKIALNQKGLQFDKANALEIKLDNAKAKYAIKKTAYEQAVKNTGIVQAIFDAASALFDKMSKFLAQMNQHFIKAQNDSIQAASNLQNAITNVAAGTQDVNAAFKDLSNAKRVLQNLKNNNSMLEFKVNDAFDGRGIANFQNDAANAAYNTANNNLNKALLDLRAANSTVFELQHQASSAKNHLGQAKFNLTQAMNTLFVAQAAKQQSDKALLIASAQSSQLPTGQTTYIFSGCDLGNYPIISGTASITGSSKVGFQLNSGYNILYGNCTETGGVTFTHGDIVNFRGYLKNGFIQGVKIDKM